MKQLGFAVLATALVLSGTSQLPADVIYTNIGGADPFGYPYFSTSGQIIGHHPGFLVDDAVAVQFTPTGNYTFADAVLALGYQSDTTTRKIDVNLTSDVAGRPGTILESFSTTSEGLFPPSSLITFTSVLHPALTAGSNYWLVVFAPHTTDGVWNINATGDRNTNTTNPNYLFNTTTGGPDGPWTPIADFRTAFQVDGSPTTLAAATAPEPTSLTLCGTAAFGFLVHAWRRRKQALR